MILWAPRGMGRINKRGPRASFPKCSGLGARTHQASLPAFSLLFTRASSFRLRGHCTEATAHDPQPGQSSTPPWFRSSSHQLFPKCPVLRALGVPLSRNYSILPLRTPVLGHCFPGLCAMDTDDSVGETRAGSGYLDLMRVTIKGICTEVLSTWGFGGCPSHR